MADTESENEIGRDVDASMRLFERSNVGEASVVTPIRPSRILLVLDGSPQDDASIAAASTMRERFNTETIVLDARDHAEGADTSEQNIAPERAAEVSGARPIARGEGEAYDVILSAVQTHEVDLVILPCPFGRPMEKIGTDSAGTVIDVMLARLKTAMLVIRRDDMRFVQCSESVAMVIGGECEAETLASRWAFGLAADGASVSLNLVLEKEAYQNMRSIFEAINPGTDFQTSDFSDALAKSHAGLHGSMAKTAAASSMSYRLVPIAGEMAPPNPLQDKHKMLIVIPLEADDRFTQGFAQDRIRRSPHPVLVVPNPNH